MIYFLLILIILAIVGYHYYYRLQVSDLTKQLKVISKSPTNQLLTQEIFSSEMNELVKRINLALIKERNIYRELQIEQRSKQELMINLSHDVRTPLTSLMGYLQLMETSEDENDKQRYFQIIYQRIDHLKNLLDRLFLLERLQDTEFEYKNEILNLNEIITQHVLSFYDQLKTANIEVELDLSDGGFLITSDVRLLNHALDNLVKNVLDHGKDYLKIKLTGHKVEEELTSLKQEDLINQTKREVLPDNANVVRIIYCNRLSHPINEDPNTWLNRFYQAKNKQSKTKQNTGLGLNIIKIVIEKLGGQIYLETKGSDILINLYFPI
ncbi:sensor histidine kinase [Facklamia sp. P12934]|uniref:sensor histidine kinase n=1 Tax=Facklamia sp. P12934 TaxID=3421948 RepID=UPI003D17E148